jgi:hypothetical protein
MNVDIPALFRDFLYLGAALIGAALGCILSLFRGDLSPKCRNRIVSLIFWIFSGAVIAITAAILNVPGDFSGFPALFRPLLLPLAVVALIFLGGCRFPRAGFFLTLPAGLSIVWLGYSFLRFPLIGPEGKILALVDGRGDGTYSLCLESPPHPARPKSSGLVRREFFGASLEVEGVYVFLDERFPLIGGKGRGLLQEVRGNGEMIFSGPLGETSLLGAYYARFPPSQGNSGIVLKRFYTTLNLALLPPGGIAAVILNGEALSSRPAYEAPPGGWRQGPPGR